MIWIILLIQIVSWTYYQKFQFRERDLVASNPEAAYEANKKWHIWKGVNHFSVYMAIWSNYGILDALIFGMVFWFVFDILCNVMLLGRHAFYVGQTAETDKLFRYIGEKIKIKPEIAQFVVKVITLGILFTIKYAL